MESVVPFCFTGCEVLRNGIKRSHRSPPFDQVNNETCWHGWALNDDMYPGLEWSRDLK